MSEKNHQDGLEDFFRQSLKGYAENPADENWEKIAGALPKRGKVSPYGSAWAWIIGAFLLALLAGSYWMWFDPTPAQELKAPFNQVPSPAAPQASLDSNNPTENLDLQPSIQPANPSSLPEGVTASEKTIISRKLPETTTPPLAAKMASAEDVTHSSISNLTHLKSSTLAGKHLESNRKASNPLILPELLLRTYPNFPMELNLSAKWIHPDFISAPAKESFNTQRAFEIAWLGDIPINSRFSFQMGMGFRQLDFSGRNTFGATYTKKNIQAGSDGVLTGNYALDFPNAYTTLVLNTIVSQQTLPEVGLDPVLQEGSPFMVKARMEHQARQLFFPVLLKTGRNHAKWGWRARAGLVGTIQVSSKSSATLLGFDNNRLNGQLLGIREVNPFQGPKVELFLSSGLEYRIAYKWWISAEPTVNLPILGNFHNTPPRLFGLQVGIVRKGN